MGKVIGILAGSLHRDSFSKKIAKTIKSFVPQEGYEFKIIDLEGLPVYNQDFDTDKNIPWAIERFRADMQSVNGVIFVTPEYNRSVPSVLKNAIDIGSTPFGKSIWNGKPAAIFSHSPGNISGFGANHHLRQSLVFLNMPTMQQPEVYITNSDALFSVNGVMIEGSTKDFVRSAVNSYIKWFEKSYSTI
ncbi:NAD(P)H-dependent oxidoreductase [Chryseobacterium sp. B21-037]|uniref:NADPH-dependent FMN reductase n=1 Tax=Chryseobacterium sp. B21-037 TaxID=2926038 RepID=UPI0023588219|nr:NAD(P)H-dependent oxidoreductase [Chryseobacterium sp. B21-037]MDC8102913.1 NAD(P)H-dependent oxidoreductase [Chryseobacterium sp. B21-037]MDC8107177.1 NAD(P)H-dependent oxidoreductase [Chryseobacterium sp. B21-037]WBV56370.1 NAD(P)H-dependent oxidoreductase [Chryseobacterium daecheongense]WBV56403.1 NAD(P)H-dependent oxidoreductase [Chryseobacterium daecheongense]